MDEIWKDVIGFEAHYEVSNQGNIRRKGKTQCLKKTITSDGYIVHCFSVNGFRYHVVAHQVVNEAFNGPKPPFLFTRHRDKNSLNNRADNLFWGPFTVTVTI